MLHKSGVRRETSVLLLTGLKQLRSRRIKYWTSLLTVHISHGIHVFNESLISGLIGVPGNFPHLPLSPPLSTFQTGMIILYY